MHHDSVAFELVDQVVGHRLLQVGAPVQQGYQRAAPSEPHGGLAGRVPSADNGHALGPAELRLGRAGGVEDTDALVLVEVVDGQAPVLRAGGDQDRSGSDFAILLQLDDVAYVAGLERDRTIWRGQARVELSRLGDGAARELVACDPRREAEVILDPSRRTRLPAEPSALDDERVQALGRSVDGGAETGGTGADHDQIDLFARREL